MESLLAALGGYLLGSVPFGLLLTKAAGLGDIRAVGSGNIGATNVLRTGNKKLAAATLILDGAKGAVAALIAWGLAGEDMALIAGFFAVLGHNFPVWLKFKGGKGVATTLGTLLAVSWPAGLAAIATWLLAAKLGRISSLAALAALGLSPLYAYFFASPRHAALALVLAALGFFRHKANIERLLAGTEPRIGEKK
ncbi:MAG: glycerol-3-phosphate 1-O-acyltransferase PlsY [Rhodospirillales bacterium]|nr:glycerol-3-phosphate 1-O-acyltransferase PlsY [Rhodospirillales bacterium]MDK9721315.1 glycerol-3-phosphate 1-O-acyltransferase PlsY [Rhodospirillales bacterium]